jgi:hypothetical protein
MLSWRPRRRARIERIEAEAEALVHDFGEAAYDAARLREHEASSDEMARDWDCVALAVARLIGGRNDVDPMAPLAMNAVLVPNRDAAASREPRSRPGLKRAEELAHVIAAATHPFRIQFIGAAVDGRPITLKEVEVEVADVSSAIVAAANIAWPSKTMGLRILDGAGREVFARQKAGR